MNKLNLLLVLALVFQPTILFAEDAAKSSAPAPTSDTAAVAADTKTDTANLEEDEADAAGEDNLNWDDVVDNKDEAAPGEKAEVKDTEGAPKEEAAKEAPKQ